MDVRKVGEPRNVCSRDSGRLLRELGIAGVRDLSSARGEAVAGEVSVLPFDEGAAFAFHFQTAVFIEQAASGLATFISSAGGLALELSEPSRTFAVEGTGLLYAGGAPTRISVRADTPVQGLVIGAGHLKEHLAAWFPERDATAFADGATRYGRSRVAPINRFLGFLLREAGVMHSVGGAVSLARQKAALLDMLVENFEPEETRAEWSVSPGHLKRAETFVLNNLAEDFSAADVAAAAGVSPRSLYRAFQDFRGLSFSQFVRNARMDAARELLRDEPGLPLKAVARRVGYGDYTSFWRHFRARFGISPSAGEDLLAA